MPIHPVRTTRRLRDTYLRYLKTIKPFQDERLRLEFSRALEEENLLVKGPYLEITPPFVTGKSIGELVKEGVLSPLFARLCHNAGLEWGQPLYLHQETAIRKIVTQRRNVIVTTGTGSGKTEAFLIPVLNHLLCEAENGTLSQPGVRALFLYPMNALANDQMNRLRSVLARYEEITFGRYIGETKEQEKEARDEFVKIHHQPPPKNELISRWQMQQTPPHILLTNYAMLEYLLLRPDDSPLFDGETGKHWRYIVLDEAHAYDGAQATEIAMLLRRLQDRVTMGGQKRLQAILTSATLGEDTPESSRLMVNFASDLFALPFEWEENDPDRQDIVRGERSPETALGESWGSLLPHNYRVLEEIADNWRNNKLFQMPTKESLSNVPPEILEQAMKAAQSDPEQAAPQFLFAILRGDRNLRTLRVLLREKPLLLQEAAERIFCTSTSEEAQEALANLVSTAILARETPKHAPLLPARYHVFLRALEGAFVCLNAGADEHRGEESKPLLFLRRHKICPHCGSRVFELANCTRCGAAYLIGDLKDGEGLDEEDLAFEVAAGRKYLVQNSVLHPNEIEAKNLKYYALERNLAEADEDALIEGEAEEGEGPGESLHPMELCPRCGALYDRDTLTNRCSCGIPLLPVSEVEMGRRTTLRRCTSCSAYSRSGIIYRFLTGQDAPVSVLAGAFYEDVPAAPDQEAAQQPGEGRKMLIFTDNRQQAAFFASYLERAQERVLHRRLMVEMLKQACPSQKSLRLPDAHSRLITVANDYCVFGERESLENKRKQVAVWLMQEFSGLDKRLSLEGVGLMCFRPVRKEDWRPPQDLLDSPWNFQPEDIFNLIAVLLDTLRRQGAVSYLLSDEGIDLLTDCRDDFLPRARPFFVRENIAESTYKYGIYSWLPTSQNNSRLDFVCRLLKRRMPDFDDTHLRQMASEILRRLWSYLTGVNSPVREWWLKSKSLPNNKGVVYYLAHDVWEIVPTLGEDLSAWYICNRCRNLSAINLNYVCPTYGCAGELEPLENHRSWIEDNLYRYQYQYASISPLRAQEHTAQWKPSKAAEVQKDFIEGKLNVLSCSTTFELGVDVGDLNAVVLRNMPPSTTNYVQRAGRAGRRTDSVALVMTFAQRRPHDLTFYEQPEHMIGGKIRPPIVSLMNDKIIRRHLHSVVFSEFFRWAKEEIKVRYYSTGDFFDPEDQSFNGVSLLRQFLESRPVALQTALLRIIPGDETLRKTLKLDDWGWVESLVGGDEALLNKTAEIIQDELREFRRLEEEATNRRNYKEADQYMEIQNQIRQRALIGYLGAHNILPKYSFPTDVVRLQTDHLNIPGAGDIELERDLKIAISEFAPGGQVIAAKRIWYSGAVRKMPNRLWTPYAYAICNDCKRMTIFPGDDRTPTQCSSCNQPIRASYQKGVFIVPEHGFIADSRTEKPGEQSPERTYASRVYFSHYSKAPEVTSEREDLSLIPDPAFSSGIPVYKGYSKYAWLAMVNNGYSQGFTVCVVCGYAEVIDPGQKRRRPSSHKNLLTGKDCSGTLKPYHLGHRFMTDALELRLGIPLRGEGQVLSFLYAILNGASEALTIPREDIGGLVYYSKGNPYFILYDDTPGGSGYVKHIHDHLFEVFESAYRRVSQCNGCSAETSCYSCLRGYDNQPYHDKLERHLAWRILGMVLGRPKPERG